MELSPSKCPVCEGKRTLPADFYGEGGSEPIKCESCGGRGLVWPALVDRIVVNNLTVLGTANFHKGKEFIVGIDPGVPGGDHGVVTMSTETYNQFGFDWTELMDDKGPWSLVVMPTQGIPVGEEFPQLEQTTMYGSENPVRRELLARLASLPEDMPVMFLTPQSMVEMAAAESFAASSEDDDLRNLFRQMHDWAYKHG